MGTRFHNCSPHKPHPFGIKYEEPAVFSTRAKGHDVGMTSDEGDEERRAIVTDISIVREIQTQHPTLMGVKSRPKRTLTPYELGMTGRKLSDNPFDMILDHADYDEWMEGYESHCDYL